MTTIWIFIYLTTFILKGSLTNSIITTDEDEINIYCNGTELDVFIRNHSGLVMTKIRAKFYQYPSVASYLNVLESLNVNISTVEELQLIEVPFDDQLYASQFKESTDPEIQQIRMKSYNVSITEWRGCNKLKMLVIEEGDISEMKDGWLRSCLQLSYLHMERMKSLTPQMLQKTLIGLTSLVTLKVRNCDLKLLDEKLYLLANLHKLKHLDLSHNALRHLILSPLLSLIHLDLSYNYLYNKEEVMILLKGQAKLQNLSLAFNSLLNMCTKGQNSIGISPSRPTLERLNLSSTGSTDLCFNEMDALTHLDLSNNQIYNLTADALPDSLLWIDLSGNQLSQIDALTFEMIFNVSSRQVRFAGNPIPCDCEHQSLVKMLQQYLEQLEDSDELICWGLEEVMSTVDSEALCTTPMSSWEMALIAVGGGLLVLLALVCCYRRIFSRRKHYSHAISGRSGIRTDKLYDVFISYAHGDEEFVMEELLPGLETAPYCYRVCIHTRDWVVGDWIPAQITRSVEQSWCSIVVLSEHYVTSIWGMLEFRAAYEAAMTMSQGRTRIIVVALDDAINNKHLDPVLHGFLRCNTFLQWGDKWFWSKLRRVLVVPYRFQAPENNVNVEFMAIEEQSQETSAPPLPPPTPQPPSVSDSSRAFCGVSKDCTCIVQ